MKVPVLNIKGKTTGREIELSKNIFGIDPNEHAVYLDVKQFLANQRQGNAKTKERSEIKGSTRKIKKQKGTGTARAGSIKNPLFRGGGTVFGPRTRDYGIKLNKNVKRLARKSALSIKLKAKSISVIESLNFKNPKTKSFIDVLSAIGLDTKKTLFVTNGLNKNVYLSARNLNKSEVITDSEISTYKIMNAQHLVIEENVIEKLNQTQDTEKENIIKPIITEKATNDSELRNRYTFVVSRFVNKIQIKKAIQEKYSVSVEKVRTQIYGPERSTKYTKKGIQNTKSKIIKKAIVQLAEGDTIDFYSNL